MSIFKFSQLLLISLILTISCKTIKPEKPEETYIEKPFQRPTSWINIPIEIPLIEMENQINREINGLIYEDSSFTDNDNDRLMYKIWKKDNINITFKDQYFFFTIPLKIWVKTGFQAETFGIDLSQFKEINMELDVKLKSLLNFSDKWKVTPTTTPAGHTWVKKPVVKVAFFEVSLTPILDQILQNELGNITKEIDKEIQNRVQIKPYIDEAWTLIQQPFELSRQYNTWLKISPTQISMTPLRVRDNQIFTNIGIKGYLDTYFGRKPDSVINNKLPPLQTLKNAQDRFEIALTGEISHEYAKKLIEDNFVGQKYSFKNGKYNIIVKAIDLYGSNGKLVVKMNIDGSAEGEIYLSGVPVFDHNTSTLHIQNLEYDVKTKNALLRAADWMNHNNFVETIQKNFRLPLGKEIEETKRLIRQNLNNNRVTENIILNGNIENLKPGEVIISKDVIRATVTAEGQIQVKIDGFLN
jgi:hypothetical protein